MREVRAAELAMGSAVAPTVGSPDPYAAPDTGIWGPSGPGTQSSKAMLVGGRHARAMLQPQAWGTVQIRDTTWAHEWPVAGEGLVPRSDPAVRAVAERGGVLADGARMRCVCVPAGKGLGMQRVQAPYSSPLLTADCGQMERLHCRKSSSDQRSWRSLRPLLAAESTPSVGLRPTARRCGRRCGAVDGTPSSRLALRWIRSSLSSRLQAGVVAIQGCMCRRQETPSRTTGKTMCEA